MPLGSATCATVPSKWSSSGSQPPKIYSEPVNMFALSKLPSKWRFKENHSQNNSENLHMFPCNVYNQENNTPLQNKRNMAKLCPLAFACWATGIHWVYRRRTRFVVGAFARQVRTPTPTPAWTSARRTFRQPRKCFRSWRNGRRRLWGFPLGS